MLAGSPVGQRLPDEAGVIRGGRVGLTAALRESAADCFAKTGTCGLSVCSLPDLSAEEIAIEVGTGRLPHPTMRRSTVGALRAVGFDVVPSGHYGHATLKLPDAPTDT